MVLPSAVADAWPDFVRFRDAVEVPGSSKLKALEAPPKLGGEQIPPGGTVAQLINIVPEPLTSPVMKMFMMSAIPRDAVREESARARRKRRFFSMEIETSCVMNGWSTVRSAPQYTPDHID
jgi:hypothetical protein